MPASPRILILQAHTTPQRSRIHRHLARAVSGLPRVRTHDLYANYPDFDIDAVSERGLLTTTDLLVLQHPIQWYGAPALLKEWFDVVLTEGWVHGPDGRALQGKDCWLVAWASGMHDASQEDTRRIADIFVPPIQHMAQSCGLRWLPPLILPGDHHIDDMMLDTQTAL